MYYVECIMFGNDRMVLGGLIIVWIGNGIELKENLFIPSEL